jgi:MFS family permease
VPAGTKVIPFVGGVLADYVGRKRMMLWSVFLYVAFSGLKRRVRAMLGFKAFWSAAIIIPGIEIMHMIRKGQLRSAGKLRPAQQFYALAA